MEQQQPVGQISVARIDGEWFVLCRVQGLHNGRLVQIGPAPSEEEARTYARQVAEHLIAQMGPDAHGEVVFDAHGPQA